jgi:3-isopropylmalate/(R)-2-methylmalate dehydratase small subunit
VEPFTTHTGRAMPLRRSNVDTDQIIPSDYLKRVTRTGFADGLFAAWRGTPGFPLDDPAYAGATVLITGPDFGTGSSREHAVWALQDYGFRTVISARFADIFQGNALKNGVLPVVLSGEVVESLLDLVETAPATEVTVDLTRREVRAGEMTASFDIDEHSRGRLLEGLDDIALTERHSADITAFEADRARWLPTTVPVS